MEQVCVDPSRITALTLPACCCALALAADMDRKAAAIDGTDRQTDGRTDGHRTVTMNREASVNIKTTRTVSNQILTS